MENVYLHEDVVVAVNNAIEGYVRGYYNGEFTESFAADVSALYELAEAEYENALIKDADALFDKWWVMEHLGVK